MEINHILIVEDDKEIREGVEIYLKSQGYQVFQAGDGVEGLEILEREEIHLAIVDIMMPRMDGIQMTMKLREKYDFPVIMLSAKSEEVDKITGLNLGADDYVTKPFSMKILLKRVEAALRHAGGKEQSPKDLWADGFLSLDFGSLTARRGQEQIAITPNEYKLLRVLTENEGNVLTRQTLLGKLWDSEGNYIDDHTLTVTMNRLRAKIEGEGHTYIRTVRGMGYIWTGGKA